MRTNIYTGQYLLVDKLAISDRIILKAYWKNDHYNMTDEEYRDEVKSLIELVQEKKPKRMLGDMKNFTFPIDPETQIWLNENLFETYIKQGIDKLALILSNDLFSQISIEQTVEEEATFAFETKYFNNLDEAYSWLEN